MHITYRYMYIIVNVLLQCSTTANRTRVLYVQVYEKTFAQGAHKDRAYNAGFYQLRKENNTDITQGRLRFTYHLKNAERGRHSGQSARHPKVSDTLRCNGQPGRGRRSLVTEEMKAIVEQQMRDDDETTAIQLLISRGHNRQSLESRE